MHFIMLIALASCKIGRKETVLVAQQSKRYPILSIGIDGLILKSYAAQD